MSRYNISYRYSLDYGTNWIDLSDIVDSSQTSIVHNLCSAGFKSQKDTASFTIPAVQSAVKQNLINALIDNSTILVEIKEDTSVIFTGYVNKDSISIRSYPLTATLTIELTDVSTKALDDKVEEHIYLKEKTVTQIVHYLLDKAGYSYDSSTILPSDEITLEAFVIDKDSSDTYREYIDTLLFEVGGYVLDFNEKGIARIVKIDWKASGTASIVDNPTTSEGVTTKTNILKEDGVSLEWSSTKWSEDNNQLLWQDSISRKLEDNYIVGEDVENEAYWPEDGELSPVYQEYNADLLDTDYLTNATRKQNEDLAIIVAEDIRAEIQATKNNEAFTAWQYPIIQDFVDDYGLTENPIAYPKKAWYLLRNNSGETVNIQHFRLYGKVFYRDKLQTLKTKNTKNPKEYESKYIYSETHANQFLQFYWHFLQTSRTSVSWKEVGSEHTLGDIVQVYHKGSLSYIKAVIAGITTTFIGSTKITSFSAVGVSAQIIPYPTLSIISTKGAGSSRSILAVTDLYATTATQSGVKSDWQSTIPTLSNDRRFLWQKETIYYTDGTSSEVIALIGTYGERGESGTSFSIMDRGFYTDTLANIKALEGQEVAWVANSFNGKVGDVLLVPCMISDLDNSIGYLPFTVSAIGDGYTLVGTNGYLIYGQEGEKGEDGFSYTVTIQSSNGNTFRMSEAVDTVLSVQVLRNGEDITSSMADYRFSWKRNTGNTTADNAWNSLDKAISHKSVSITKDDCIGRTVFDCEVNLDNLT